MLILAGCGGSSAPKPEAWQAVRAPGLHFQAPRSWQVTRAKAKVAAKDGPDFVEVTTFSLVRAYDPSLFGPVRGELDRRMTTVAGQSSGSVTAHRTDTVAGIKSHSYDVTVGDRVETYTFVLRGMREYQLLCSADADVCARLLTSFAVS